MVCRYYRTTILKANGLPLIHIILFIMFFLSIFSFQITKFMKQIFLRYQWTELSSQFTVHSMAFLIANWNLRHETVGAVSNVDNKVMWCNWTALKTICWLFIEFLRFCKLYPFFEIWSYSKKSYNLTILYIRKYLMEQSTTILIDLKIQPNPFEVLQTKIICLSIFMGYFTKLK